MIYSWYNEDNDYLCSVRLRVGKQLIKIINQFKVSIMIKTIYRSNRVFESKDKTTTASVVYEIGEMKSSIDTSMAVMADKAIIEVVCTFDEAIQSINKHWEQVKMEAMNKSIDEKLKEKRLRVQF